jgi:uncharacterized damage-inducible protein DinB
MRPRTLLATCLLTLSAASALQAQSKLSGWRGEFLDSFTGAEKKYLALAEATPWSKFSWRPAAGVRSVCEVFLHISGAGYLFSTPLGAKTPAGVNLGTIESCPASKDQVLATMRAGFAQMRTAVEATSDADADALVDLFGSKMPKRKLLLITAEHMGEHLGQSIAYARTNGVVPPWSMKSGG